MEYNFFCEFEHAGQYARVEFASSMMMTEFLVSGVENRYNCHIWVQKWPHEIYMHARDDPKFNVSYGILHCHTTGPSFFC
jgi:hypothetical protein